MLMLNAACTFLFQRPSTSFTANQLFHRESTAPRALYKQVCTALQQVVAGLALWGEVEVRKGTWHKSCYCTSHHVQRLSVLVPRAHYASTSGLLLAVWLITAIGPQRKLLSA
jgi:hypothetical protein